jgi:hypothetical protein
MWALVPPEKVSANEISLTLVLLKDRETTLLAAGAVENHDTTNDCFPGQRDPDLRGFISEGLLSLQFDHSYNPMLYLSGLTKMI